ncbi:tetratricopeptide repeat protein [Massilia arenosa]|uniref:Tetratricopeptide repeat protein n=1 Tax=Zemynaea arenosa TaxID=2561931 RepID=A0A4Y9RVU5_9BURK|nr:tetratricopeptide repeat protein [Massilia arenosa]TFW11418.1 tetratricopeptide repeat protein [Massilia arenosa]
MPSVSSTPPDADALFDAALAASEAGDRAGAVAHYRTLLALEPERKHAWYNLGLQLKYLGQWDESLRANQRALELAPENNEAAIWNAAIAATALRDWTTARAMWQRYGIQLQGPVEGEIEDNFGVTPVRLNPDGQGEVVWSRRIDPARARLLNVPLPESGYRFKDIVLHDGAPAGYRKDGDRDVPVFNVLELFQPGPFGTFEVMLDVPTEEAMQAFQDAADRDGMYAEDWTASYQTICKACSEGRPHDHEHQPDDEAAEWQPERRVGLAATSRAQVERLLAHALPPGVEVIEWTTALEPRAS